MAIPTLVNSSDALDADYQNVAWQDLLVTAEPADSEVLGELNISEVVLSRADWLAELHRQADAALAINNWPLAEQALQQALAEYPDDHGSRLRLAALLYGRGALVQAREQLQIGLTLAPEQADLRLTLARLLAEQQRYNAALQVLDEVHPPLFEHLDYYSLKADMARRSNQCEQAIATYKQLLEHNRVGGWWLGLGLCQRQIGEDFTAAFLQARSSANLGAASQRFVEQQLQQLQQRGQDGQTQTD
ncbi:tetratricopeptide repeat protein [Oceanisphaera sp.]|uniref:tetratricopeptide repeat protein n=1 Tax=Oceanisphaera sp. TaxID=1929979 RepID=UPI003A954DB5